MTLREYRKGDSTGVADLWRRNPSKEYPLLGFDPDAVGGVLRQTERPHLRFLLGLARLVRRPIFVMEIVDLDGRVMGTTLLNFTREAGHLSGVVVESSIRRRGHAQEMLRACDLVCRRYGRRFVVLDVLSENAPAVRLYDRWGYRRLRDNFWLSRAIGPDTPLPPVTGTTRIRPFRRSDGARLAAIDNEQMPPEVRLIVPRHPGEFRYPPIARTVFKSETESWVAEVDGAPAGFLRATISHLMEAANLSSPVFCADVAEPVARDLLVTALRWAEGQKSPRILTELPEHRASIRPWLDRLGFVEQFRVHTMVHRLEA